MIPVSEQIRNLRNGAGETQAELAKGAETSPSMISTWESPEYEGHTVSTLNKIANHYEQDLIIQFVPRKKRKRK